MLVANYFDSGKGLEPCIFTLDVPPGIATKQKGYAAVGCGANTAEFLLSWFDFGKMQAVQAAITAAFIVGELKKADCYCGGPTQLRILYPGAPKSMGFDGEAMRLIEMEVESGAAEVQADLGSVHL